MKRNVLVIAGLAVLSTSAFASKARIEALGQGAIFNVKDSRSVFVNPASLNGMGNTIVTEWGTGGTTDGITNPRAEGGFTREMGSFNYGLYMGNDSSRLDHTGTFLDQSNGLDLMLAGDMGMKWGARLHYANRTDEATNAPVTQKHSALGVGLGVMQGDLGAYLNMDLNDKSSGTSANASYTSKIKPSFTLGADYMWSGYKFYAEYTANKIEEVTATTTTTKDTTIIVGAGRTHEINPTSRVIYNAMLSMNTNDVTGTGKTKTNKLPVTVALETEATSWLTLRGSISQNVIIGDVKNTAGKKKTTPNSTDVSAGAALNFGKLTLDGMIGNTGSSRNNGTVGNDEGTLTTDNLMTRVGLTYKF